jgi:hypothetical protein
MGSHRTHVLHALGDNTFHDRKGGTAGGGEPPGRDIDNTINRVRPKSLLKTVLGLEHALAQGF